MEYYAAVKNYFFQKHLLPDKMLMRENVQKGKKKQIVELYTLLFGTLKN